MGSWKSCTQKLNTLIKLMNNWVFKRSKLSDFGIIFWTKQNNGLGGLTTT